METMKRAVITGVKQATLVETPIPEPREDWVLVKVYAVPLCTEYKGWLSGESYSGHSSLWHGRPPAENAPVYLPSGARDRHLVLSPPAAVFPQWLLSRRTPVQLSVHPPEATVRSRNLHSARPARRRCRHRSLEVYAREMGNRVFAMNTLDQPGAPHLRERRQSQR